MDKRKALQDVMDKVMAEGGKVLVFVATKRNADMLTNNLRRDGWPAKCIHGMYVRTYGTARPHAMGASVDRQPCVCMLVPGAEGAPTLARPQTRCSFTKFNPPPPLYR